jgi:hypothetical protein
MREDTLSTNIATYVPFSCRRKVKRLTARIKGKTKVKKIKEGGPGSGPRKGGNYVYLDRGKLAARSNKGLASVAHRASMKVLKAKTAGGRAALRNTYFTSTSIGKKKFGSKFGKAGHFESLLCKSLPLTEEEFVSLRDAITQAVKDDLDDKYWVSDFSADEVLMRLKNKIQSPGSIPTDGPEEEDEFWVVGYVVKDGVVVFVDDPLKVIKSTQYDVALDQEEALERHLELGQTLLARSQVEENQSLAAALGRSAARHLSQAEAIVMSLEKQAPVGTGARFKALAAKVHSPALAAYIGRKKYGDTKFTKLAVKGAKQAAKESMDEVKFAVHATHATAEPKSFKISANSTRHAYAKAKSIAGKTGHKVASVKYVAEGGPGSGRRPGSQAQRQSAGDVRSGSASGAKDTSKEHTNAPGSGYKGRIAYIKGRAGTSSINRIGGPGVKSAVAGVKGGVANARALKLMKALKDRSSFASGIQAIQLDRYGTSHGQRAIAGRSIGRIAKLSAAYPRAAKRFGKSKFEQLLDAITANRQRMIETKLPGNKLKMSDGSIRK